MPTFRRLFPGEIEIHPPIFSFTTNTSWTDESLQPDEYVESRERWNADIAACVGECEGLIYLDLRHVVFFGFPQLASATAIERAVRVFDLIDAQHPGRTMLSVSTVGLSEHSHVHAHMADHIGDPKLVEILNARMKFLDYESYLLAVEKLRQP